MRRIGDDAVLYTILGVAGGDGGLMNDGIFRGRDVTGLVLMGRLPNPELAKAVVRRVAIESTGGDGIIVLREALHFG